MPTIDLNILQERELARLLDYERATCTVDGDLVYHCAFPYRPDDDLQVELIAHGALMQKIDDRRGTVVTITSDGYSYFPMLKQEEEERKRRERRETRLVGTAALFAALSVVIGFLLGKFFAYLARTPKLRAFFCSCTLLSSVCGSNDAFSLTKACMGNGTRSLRIPYWAKRAATYLDGAGERT